VGGRQPGATRDRISAATALEYQRKTPAKGRVSQVASNRDGNYEIYLIDADGTGPRNLTRHPAQDNFATRSPDGRRIGFISTRDGGHDVYVIGLH
jgi:Tol biopolymer transport system component